MRTRITRAACAAAAAGALTLLGITGASGRRWKRALAAGDDEIFRPGSLPGVGSDGVELEGAGQR